MSGNASFNSRGLTVALAACQWTPVLRVSAGTPDESTERSDTWFDPEERSALAQSAAPMRASTPAHGRAAHATHATGFTLVEVLATLMLMAIVLPAIMQGVSISTGLAATAQRRSEAAALGESKLSELLATGQWQGQPNLSGNFAPDWPTYQWMASIGPWSQDTTSQSIQEIDLKVTWQSRGKDDSLTLSTLAYMKGTASQ